MSAIIYWQNPCKLPMSFRCIKAYMLAFSGRFSRKCLEGISFNFFVCFIFDWSIGSAQKKKKHTNIMLYQNWNRTPVYFELAVSGSYIFISCWKNHAYLEKRRRKANLVSDFPLLQKIYIFTFTRRGCTKKMFYIFILKIFRSGHNI